MKQSTIKLILGVIVFLGLLSSLTSCTSEKTSCFLYRADNLESHTISSVYIPSDIDVYAAGDTILVNAQGCLSIDVNATKVVLIECVRPIKLDWPKTR